eukprot:4556026-Amphidinium_carterae.1
MRSAVEEAALCSVLGRAVATLARDEDDFPDLDACGGTGTVAGRVTTGPVPRAVHPQGCGT